MPQIQRGAISGCCVGTYFYDLGGAHNKYRSKNIEEFALRMLELGMNRINIAATNSNQGPERKYLEQLGFKEIMKAGGGMHVHGVDSDVLTKHLEPYRKILAEKAEKERLEKIRIQKEKEEAERKRREKEEAERKKREEKALKQMKDLKVITSTDDVTIEWVRETYKKYSEISLDTLFNHLFGFKKIPPYEREWDDEALLRSINSRLRKRREKK